MIYWCTGSTCWMLEGTRFHVFLFFWVHLRQILFQFDSVTFGSCRLAGGCSAKMPSSCDPINYLVATLIFASNIWILLKLLSSFMNHNFQHIHIFCRGFSLTINNLNLENITGCPTWETAWPLNRAQFPVMNMFPRQVSGTCLFRQFIPANKPIPSMYGIFTHIWPIVMLNVGKYSIHGCYGNVGWCSITLPWWSWYILPPIIMVQWNMGPCNSSYLFEMQPFFTSMIMWESVDTDPKY